MNYVYILRCADDTLYCGWTTDLTKRLVAHNSGRGAKYTRSRRPVELIYVEEYEDRHDALSQEWHMAHQADEPGGEAETMQIAAMTFRLHAPWVHSLKEKRMVVKSLVAKTQNRFHASVAEIAEQDTHQIIVIGVAVIVPHDALADHLMDEISSFIEANTDAEILDETREIR